MHDHGDDPHNGLTTAGDRMPQLATAEVGSAVVPTSIAGEAYSADYPPPPALLSQAEFLWNEDEVPVVNYRNLGRRLADGDLYRRPAYASGLLLGSNRPNIDPVVIDKGQRLAAIITDRVRVRYVTNGNTRGNHIPTHHLNTMLASEAFLQNFRPVDAVVKVAQYLPNFEVTRPGYNDGGPGHRLLYLGAEAEAADSLDTIKAFLEVMQFAGDADRTNTVALAITVLLRHRWPGSRPVGVVTSSKSHGGKDTCISFAAGSTPKVSVDYESADWAFRQGFVAALKSLPDAGLVNVENARLGKGDQFIASAFLEKFLTEAEPSLYSSKIREPLKIKNHLVVTISTNFGQVSNDLMNRALPIHLNPVGDVADRHPKIGNPKLEFLPANRARIEAELRGMIERWKAAGRPRDTTVRHPMGDWARTVGGIMGLNGFKGFLHNYKLRKTADDPLRQGLGLLGAARADQWLRPDDWARLAQFLGLVKAVIPPHERDTDRSRERGIGAVMTAHRDESFTVETDDARVTLRLEKRRARFGGRAPATHYRFVTVRREALPEDPPPAAAEGGNGAAAT
jgi:hypothetical protein